jgi:hypothetical protein
MSLGDYGFGAALAFGVWWIVFPRSVIRFYTWFHRGRVAMPRPIGVRLAGFLWVALIVLASLLANR